MIQTIKMEHPETGEIQMVKALRSFGGGNAFAVRQTDFDPLPETPTLVDRLGVDDAAKALDQRLSWQLQDRDSGLLNSRSDQPGPSMRSMRC